jgi:predicted GNAT superfamily acetyltransferase
MRLKFTPSTLPTAAEKEALVATMPDNQVSIRTLETIGDFEQAEVVQRHIWGMQDATQVIPLHVLLTAQKNGGLVAGAFNDYGEMIGVLFGFLGFTPQGKLKHCSHLMGVLPGVRRQSVGQALKLFQRQYVLNQGLDLITWTFDPLEGVNASLNIGKLGAIAHQYYPNLYGSSMADGLNSGLPTDRFEVEWWIASQRVRQFVEGEPRPRPGHCELLEKGAALVNRTRLDAEGALHPLASELDVAADCVLIEVPAEFQAIKAVSMDLARAWRQHTGALFTHYFERGYVASDFLSDRDDTRRRNFYVLTRGEEGLSSGQNQTPSV